LPIIVPLSSNDTESASALMAAAISLRVTASSASHHPQRGHVEVEDRLLFLALHRVLAAHGDDGADRLDIETDAAGLLVDLTDIVGDRRLLFLQMLDALDQGAQLAGGDGLACRCRRTSKAPSNASA
jgi:hypothetical protein